jgi:hypothetical protein
VLVLALVFNDLKAAWYLVERGTRRGPRRGESARVTRLRVLPEAEEELAQAAERYEEKRTGLGVELIAIVDRAFDEIQDAPLS